jgi:hypothetical protein
MSLSPRLHSTPLLSPAGRRVISTSHSVIKAISTFLPVPASAPNRRASATLVRATQGHASSQTNVRSACSKIWVFLGNPRFRNPNDGKAFTSPSHSHLISSADGHGWNRWTEREQHTHTREEPTTRRRSYRQVDNHTQPGLGQRARYSYRHAVGARPPARRPPISWGPSTRGGRPCASCPRPAAPAGAVAATPAGARPPARTRSPRARRTARGSGARRRRGGRASAARSPSGTGPPGP